MPRKTTLKRIEEYHGVYQDTTSENFIISVLYKIPSHMSPSVFDLKFDIPVNTSIINPNQKVAAIDAAILFNYYSAYIYSIVNRCGRKDVASKRYNPVGDFLVRAALPERIPNLIPITIKLHLQHIIKEKKDYLKSKPEYDELRDLLKKMLGFIAADLSVDVSSVAGEGLDPDLKLDVDVDWSYLAEKTAPSIHPPLSNSDSKKPKLG